MCRTSDKEFQFVNVQYAEAQTAGIEGAQEKNGNPAAPPRGKTRAKKKPAVERA
jgi:hypothetical protein